MSDDESNGLTEALLASRLGPKQDVPTIDLGNRDVDLNFNWHETYKIYEQYGTIPDFENFIDNMKKAKAHSEEVTILPDVQLSHDQQQVIDLVEKQIEKIKNPQMSSYNIAKRIIIQGKAGMSDIIFYLHRVAQKNHKFCFFNN